MLTLRSSLLAALTVVASLACADTPQSPNPSGAHGFDFEVGDWRVHRRIKRSTGEGYEFDGTCSLRLLMGGPATVEEHVFDRPTGKTYGVAVRAYDAEKDHWSIA